MGATAMISIPAGVAAAIYLEELARPSRLNSFIEINVTNLAGVPSIVFGILGLAIFSRFFHLGNSVLAGALTMSLLILPVIITASREAIRAVPNSIRLAAYGIGASKWQTVSAHVLPAAIPGIVTGVILSLSRAIGETAPLITIGVPAFYQFSPETFRDTFTALPMQIYGWASDSREEFHHLAAAGIIVLLGVLLMMNAVAVFIRQRAQRNIRW
jgi:phosphate transport system permease protein